MVFIRAGAPKIGFSNTVFVFAADSQMKPANPRHRFKISAATVFEQLIGL